MSSGLRSAPVWALFLTVTVWAADAELLPVDQAAQRPDFFSFRAQLQMAIARHDAEAIVAAVHPNIKNNFGGEDGIDAFRRLWRVGEPDSPLWKELGAVLALGGTFQDEQTFVAPYTYSRWPSQYDSFEHIAVIAANVRLREAPRQDAPILRTISFAILPLARLPQQAKDPSWRAVQLDGKRIAYVDAQFARSPVAYRAFFSRRGGRWQLVTFVAGD